MNPSAGETPEKTIGAHSDGNLGIRCAGEAVDIDRGGIGFAGVVANGRSVGTSSAGGDSDPSDREKTCDSADRRSPGGQIIGSPSRDESNPQCFHDFAVLRNIGPQTWRMKCALCKGVFDLMIVRNLLESSKYQCEDCRDTGQIPVGTSGSDSDGNAMVFEPCACRNQPAKIEKPRCVCGRSENFHPWRFCDKYSPVETGESRGD